MSLKKIPGSASKIDREFNIQNYSSKKIDVVRVNFSER